MWENVEEGIGALVILRLIGVYSQNQLKISLVQYVFYSKDFFLLCSNFLD